MKREPKSKAAKSHGGLSVTAKVTGADGAEYTVCGCSVGQVQQAVRECRQGPPDAAAEGTAGGLPEPAGE